MNPALSLLAYNLATILAAAPFLASNLDTTPLATRNAVVAQKRSGGVMDFGNLGRQSTPVSKEKKKKKEKSKSEKKNKKKNEKDK